MSDRSRHLRSSLALLGALFFVGSSAFSGCVDQPLVALSPRSAGGTGAGGLTSGVGGMDPGHSGDSSSFTGGTAGYGSNYGCLSMAELCDESGGDYCCPGLTCVDGSCSSESCSRAGDGCGDDSDCCSMICADNQCVLTVTCGQAGTSCDTQRACCSMSCTSSASSGQTACTAIDGCQPLGEGCSSDVDCCSGDCVLSVCAATKRCLLSGETRCDDLESGCCAGLSCLAGDDSVSRCVPLQCQGVGWECSHDEACCGFGEDGVSCLWDAMLHRRSCVRCAPPGQACGAVPCCDGSTCTDGQCVFTTSGAGGTPAAASSTGGSSGTVSG